MKSIAIIGTGAVGSFLAHSFYDIGIKNLILYNRTIEKAKKLAQEINAQVVQTIDQLPTADFYFLTLKDDIIEKFASKPFFRDKFIIHTAGAQPIDILSYAKNYAVFYPLQTFAFPLKNKKQIPILIEASNKKALSEIKNLALKISNNVLEYNSEQRLYAHLAAVFVNNFSNHLFCLAKNILNKKNINSSILEPLIHQTFINASSISPCKLQTGPAKRNDNTSKIT